MLELVLAVVLAVIFTAVALMYCVNRVIQQVGWTMERIISAATLGQPPLGAVAGESYTQNVTGHGGQRTVPTVSTGKATEEPALPNTEGSIMRLADYLEEQYRGSGFPVGRDEAVAQARIMMADSGLQL